MKRPHVPDWFWAVLLGLLVGLYLAKPRVARLYEDGSGVLSDGRHFCIAGELCEEER